MPTVKVYQPQVQQAALPTPRAIQQDTSGYDAVAKGLGQVAGAAQGAFDANQKELEKAREAQVDDGFAQIVRKHQDIASAAEQTKGRNALENDLRGTTSKEFSDGVDGIVTTFPDVEVQKRLRHLSVQQGLALRGSVDGHVRTQADEYAKQAFGSSLSAVEEAAAKAAKLGDKDGYQIAVGSLQGLVDSQASKWGWDAPTEEAKALGETRGETAKRVQREAMDRVAQAVVPELLKGETPNTARAAAFLRENRARLTEKALSGLETDVADANRKVEGYTLAHAAVAYAQIDSENPLLVNRDKARTKLEDDIAGKPVETQALARAQLKQRLSEIDEDLKSKTAEVFARARQAFQSPGPDGEPRFKTALVDAASRRYLTDPKNGKDAADLWNALLVEERGAESQDRSRAAQPTQANWEAYAGLVRDMQNRRSTYAKMDSDRFTAEVYGKVGPLVPQVMAEWKAITAPVEDKRSLSGDERQAVLEALPPEYRPSKVTKPDSVSGKVWSLIQERVGERKASEWEDSKGPVPAAVLKKWVAEEWASGTVKGGRFDFIIKVDAKGVPKAVAPVVYPDKEWTADSATGAPGAAASAGATGEAPKMTDSDAADIQARWKKRFPGRPELSPEQVKKAYEAEHPAPAPAPAPARGGRPR